MVRTLLVLPAVTLALVASPAVGQIPKDQQTRILKLFVEEFVPITPGKGTFPANFMMGSDKGKKEETPAHEIRLKTPFALAKYEVTQELYETVVGKNPSKWKGPRNSVEMVSWKEAKEFCRLATQELRQRKLLGADEEIRLPTEAEWEYCCRAGTKTPYSFGEEAQLGEHAWFKGNSKGEDPPVGKKKPNAWGLYDMHGYIWEWCADSWHPDYNGAPTEGSAWLDREPKQGVMRGGSWNDPAERLRSAARAAAAVDHRSDTIGFRCVRARTR